MRQCALRGGDVHTITRRDHPAILRFTALTAAIEASLLPLSTEPEVLVRVDRAAASRFCFDNGTDAPGDRDFDTLLSDVFDETLESWRETIEERIEDQPDLRPVSRELALFFAVNGLPLWEDRDDEADEV